VPVRNVDRAKDFYLQLGCRLDADFVADPDGTGWLLQEIKTRLPGR
jgi:catechol 2,3-dioxygenase-like lactoylglutathione lyase family enzyme